jgi:FMN phosphatase YigB (HAD superfamily)
MDNRPKTIFCDIDGTLVKHQPPSITSKPNFKMEILPGTLEKLFRVG